MSFGVTVMSYEISLSIANKRNSVTVGHGHAGGKEFDRSYCIPAVLPRLELVAS